jgi:RNA polymerase sigma factor (sigma-70 family)
MKASKDIKQKPLNKAYGNEDEVKLFNDYQASKVYDTSGILVKSNLAIRNQLLLANKKLVGLFIGLIAKRNRNIIQKHYDDLQQEGLIGLTKAIDHFDPTRGIRFSTYAGHWVLQALTAYITKQQNVIAVPNQIRLAANKIQTFLKEKNKSHPSELTPEESLLIQETFNIPERIFNEAIKEIKIGFGQNNVYNLMEKRIVSFEQPIGKFSEPGNLTYQDCLKDETVSEFNDSNKEVTTKDVSNALYKALMSLEPLPRLVLILRFMGVNSLKEFAERDTE